MKPFTRFMLSVGLGFSLFFLLAVGVARRTPVEPSGASDRERNSQDAARPLPAALREEAKAGSEERGHDPDEKERIPSVTTGQIREFWERLVRDFGRGHKFPYAERYGVYATSRFNLERHYFLREARLLALAHPELAESWAVELVWNRERKSNERVLGIYTLGYLAAGGSKGAENALVAVAGEEDWEAANIAVRLLASLDSEGRHERLILHGASAGYPRVIEVLGGRYSSARWTVMEKILERRDEWRRYPLPRGNAAIYAELACEKLEILRSPEREEVIVSILEDRPGTRFGTMEWRRWALGVARSMNLPSLKDILRRRLDLSEERHREFFEAHPSSALNGGLERAFEKDPPLIMGLDFDDNLVHYWELGGELNDLERRRLRYAGYACDPAQRLEELIREQRR